MSVQVIELYRCDRCGTTMRKRDEIPPAGWTVVGGTHACNDPDCAHWLREHTNQRGQAVKPAESSP